MCLAVASASPAGHHGTDCGDRAFQGPSASGAIVERWIADRATAIPRGIIVPPSAPVWAALDIFVRIRAPDSRLAPIVVNLRARYERSLRGEPYPHHLHVPMELSEPATARPANFALALTRAIAASFAANGGMACFVDLPTRNNTYYVAAPAENDPNDLYLFVHTPRRRFAVYLCVSPLQRPYIVAVA